MYCTLELVDQTPIYLMGMFVNKNIVAQVIVGMMDMFSMILIGYDVEENAANLYSLTADI
jgi:queuine/archaeosine tRNA-ribosyltransferase